MKSISLSRSMIVSDVQSLIDSDYVFVDADDAADDISFVEMEELDDFGKKDDDEIQENNGSGFPSTMDDTSYDTHKALLSLAESTIVSDDDDEEEEGCGGTGDDDDDASMTVAVEDVIVDGELPSISGEDNAEEEKMDVDEGLVPPVVAEEEKIIVKVEKEKTVVTSVENDSDEAVADVKSLFASKRARRLSKKKQRALARKMKKEEKLRMNTLKEMEEAENANDNENDGMVEER